MDFLQNPFYILSASPQDNRRRIMELADSRSLVHDPDECREAVATLTHPRRRLAAEMAWMLGVLPKHIDSVLSYLESSVRNLIGMDKLAQFRNSVGISKLTPLASANLLTAGLSRVHVYPSGVVANWIVAIATTSVEINLEQVRAVINVERKVSGFPTVNLSNIEAEIQNLRDYYRQVMTSALDRLSPKERAGEMTEVVESVTDDEKHLPRLIDRLVDWYEVDVRESLEEHERKIEKLDEKLRQAADEEHPDSVLAPVVDQLIQTVNNWYAIAQPIQVSKNSRGLPNNVSKRVAWRVRDLAIHLFYEYDKLDFCQQCIKILREVFVEVAEISEVLAKDMRKLANIARKREQKALEKIARQRQHRAHRDIVTQVQKLRATADANKPDAILSPVVDQLMQSVNKWKALTPQIFATSQEYRNHYNVANLVRELALHLWIEHGKLDFSRQLLNMLQEVFTEVREIATLIDITIQVQKLRGAADAKRNDSILSPMVDQLIQSVNKWDAAGQLIESNNEYNVENLVRGLALHLWNEHDKLDCSRQLIHMLQRVFAGVDGMDDRLAKDLRTLDKIAEWRAQLLKIESLVEKLRLAAARQNAHPILATMVHQLIQVIYNLDVTQSENQLIADRVRNLAVDLFNKHDKLDLSRQLIHALKRMFVDVGEVEQRIAEDARTLDEIAERRKHAIKGKHNKGCLVVFLVVIGLILLIGLINSC